MCLRLDSCRERERERERERYFTDTTCSLRCVYHICFVSRVLLSAADGRYEEVVRLQETLCKLKEQFQTLQLTDVDKDQAKQRALYNGAREVYRCNQPVHPAPHTILTQSLALFP